MYVQFWKRTAEGKIMWKLGSDGVWFPDGRWSRAHIARHARALAKAGGFYGFTFQAGPLNRREDHETRALEVVPCIAREAAI